MSIDSGAMFLARYVLDTVLRRVCSRATWFILLAHASLGCADETWNDLPASSSVAPARRVRIRRAESAGRTPSDDAGDPRAADAGDAAPDASTEPSRDAALDGAYDGSKHDGATNDGKTTDARPPDADVLDAARPARDATAPRDAAPGARPYGTDRSTFFGESRCTTAGVEFCEGFESGSLDPAVWEVIDTPTVDTSRAARGTHALHILKVGNGRQYIQEHASFAHYDGVYWGRAFVYFVALPEVPMDYSHWTIVAAWGAGVYGEIRLGGQRFSGANWFGVGTDNRVEPTGTGDWTQPDVDPGGSPRAVPTGEWMCLEWMHSSATNETRFYWDGVEHPSMHTTETVNWGNGNPFELPSFENLWFGWWEYQPTDETFELYMDELATDRTRIGCEI